MPRTAVATAVTIAVLMAGAVCRAEGIDLRDMYPSKAMFKPGEPIGFTVEVHNPGAPTTVDATVEFTRLNGYAGGFTLPMGLKTGDNFVKGSWTPPPGTGAKSPAAFGMRCGIPGDAVESAVDVSPSWTLVPRYGFLSDFGPFDPDPRVGVKEMSKYHINAVQFYDWMYRHEELLPPTRIFTDSLGRTLSIERVRAKVAAVRSYGMAAMAYAAIYGASPEFADLHDDWNAYRSPFLPYDFGDGYLRIMNPEPGGGWAKHLTGQLRKSLTTLGFDGVHLDQYGYPKKAYGSMNALPGDEFDMARAFRGFIDQAANNLRVPVVFNCVNDWPTPLISPSKAAISYIEVWEPNEELRSLNALVSRARRLGPGKGVVLAAYGKQTGGVGPLLTDAVIMSSGGWHLELGEGVNVLTDPYFPNHSRPTPELARALRRYYDFAVRYEELLSVPSVVDHAVDVRVEGVRVSIRGEAGTLYAIGRRAPNGVIAVNLVNLLGLSDTRWRTMDGTPSPLDPTTVRVYGPEAKKAVSAWYASPDGNSLGPQPLTITRGSDANGPYTSVELPTLRLWGMLVFGP